jgi:6-pyruvoyl-tetrahydropterin synthase
MLYTRSSNHINASNTGSASEKRKPQTARQLIRENLQSRIGQLDVGHSDALAGYLNAISRLHPHTFSNSLEIAQQRSSATRVVRGYAQNQLGRYINKGEMEMTSTRAFCISLYHRNAPSLTELAEVMQRTRRHCQQLADAEASESQAEAV